MINMLLYQILISAIHGKTKRRHNEFKLSAPTREEKFELSGRSHSESDI